MFAKLFDTPHGQLLVTMEFDDTEEPANPYKMRMRGEAFKDADIAIAYSYPTLEQRDGWFERITQEDANLVAAKLQAMAQGMFGEQRPD